MDEQGKLTIYTLKNVAPKGSKPKQALVFECDAYYQEMRVGVTRYYAAQGANRRIDALIRCFATDIVKGQVVVLDGEQYQVDLAQKVIGKDCIDLTLIKVDKLYEIYNNPTE